MSTSIGMSYQSAIAIATADPPAQMRWQNIRLYQCYGGQSAFAKATADKEKSSPDKSDELLNILI
jgi:hypothetical protein